MKTVRRLLVFLSIILFAMTAFSGCKLLEDDDKIQIVIWEDESDSVRAVHDEIIEEFTKANPDIIVKRTHYELQDLKSNFINAAMAGHGPDLVIGPNDVVGLFQSGDLIIPTEELMGEEFFSRFSKNALDAVNINGKQYAIPDRNGNELLLFYNKELIDKPASSMEELIEQTHVLKEEGKIQYSIACRTDEPFFLFPFQSAFTGGKVFKEHTIPLEPDLDTPEMTEFARYIKKLHKDRVIPRAGDYNVAKALFEEGKAPYYINGPWAFVECDNANMDWGVTVLPTINGNPMKPSSAVKAVMVSVVIEEASEAKKEALIKYIDFLTSKESQLKLSKAHGQLPTDKEAAEEAMILDPIYEIQEAQLENSVATPPYQEMTKTWDAMRDAQMELLTGKIKPEDYGRKCQEKAIQYIKDLQG